MTAVNVSEFNERRVARLLDLAEQDPDMASHVGRARIGLATGFMSHDAVAAVLDRMAELWTQASDSEVAAEVDAIYESGDDE